MHLADGTTVTDGDPSSPLWRELERYRVGERRLRALTKPRKPKRRPGRKGDSVSKEHAIPQDLAQIATLIDKLRSGGPETFTGEELGRLLAAFEDVTQENLQLRRMNSGALMAALYRKRLQLVPTMDHDDGSVSFDLQPAPPDDEPPVSEPVMN